MVHAALAGLLSAAPEAVAAVFTTVPDTGVQRVLRALDRASIPAGERAVVVAAVRAAMESLPLARVAALCLMDRWLKNASPETRAAVVDAAAAELEAALGTTGSSEGVLEAGVASPVPAAAEIDALADEVLMRVPGQHLVRLGACLPAPARARLDARLARFADRVLDILGAAPKSLSQANAEELLSRRVYTDPGHFLVELLQNAEDAGARAWRVDIGDHDVAVWHDGTPFDVKDVVGVLSIGQTTKHKEQIGFFGVGFKSVYEICERPQVYSGPFCFEIADVSIPRRLAARPEGRPGSGTLLVLALRDASDPERTPDRLYERTLDVPPETLLTLRHIRELAVARRARSRTVYVEEISSARSGQAGAPGEAGEASRSGRMDLVHVESGERTGYVTVSDRFVYDGGREGSRASATDILVALRLDERGMPVPLSGDDATVYSYLPTRERSGLRFLVHAHFDLPVDRERLDLDSRYNRWVLAQAGSLLARAAQEAIAGDAERARALLAVVPRPDELAHPAYVALASEAQAALAAVPCLPGADGALVAPSQAALAEDVALVTVLAGVDLDGRGLRLLEALPAPAARTAAYLGARRFDAAGLVELVARTPAVLAHGEDALLDSLGRAADHAVIGRLAGIAFLRDEQGLVARPDELVRADEALRGVYRGLGERRLLAADLDLAASPAQERLWRRLGLAVLDAGTLIADLGDERRARALLAGDGAHAVIGYLAAQSGQLAAFVDALAGGRIAVDAERACALHVALDAAADELSPRLGARIGRAAVFPDRHGALRPLAGAGAALVPADGDIVALAPDAPWLDAGIAALPYIARLLGHLDIGPTGAAAVVSALLLEDDRLLDATSDAGARRCYSYLIAHADDVPAALRRRLAAAPVWFSAHGARLPLAGLRRPPRDPTLVALYRAWSAVPTIEERSDAADGERKGEPDERGEPGGARSVTASAMALATALGLDAHVAFTDHEALIDDLQRGLDIAPVRSLVSAALRDAARILPRARLARAARAPLFRSEREVQGELALRPLAGWTEAVEAGCARALGVLRVALAHGSRPLLASADEQELAAFLAAIDGDPAAVPASVMDLVGALERDPAMQAPAARDAGRRALAALRHELTAQRGPGADGGHGRSRALAALPALAIWPTVGGAYRPARAVVRGRDMAALLDADADTPALQTGSQAMLPAELRPEPQAESRVGVEHLDLATGGETWQRAFVSGEYGLLDEHVAAAEADALADLCGFAEPQRALRAAIVAVARPGDHLAAQHPLLGTPARVARLARAVARDAGREAVHALPLAVDVDGRLVAGIRHHADERERAILAGLPIHEQLGEPAWAALVGVALAPRLSIRQILSAIADDARAELPVAEHARLADGARRAALYQWLLDHGPAILADEQACGLVGRAAVIATAGGFLRPVRELLLDRDLPDLGIDWNAAGEVPAELVGWLRRHFAPGERQLGRLVGHLLDAHDVATAAGDGARSAVLLGHLAHSLRVGEADERHVSAAVRRFKLRKRLRVEADRGEFARPRTLLAPPPTDWPLIEAFAAAPPSRVSGRYIDESVRMLIAHAGAAVRLDDESLRALIASPGDGSGGGAKLRAPGAAAAIALGRYLAQWASREPALRDSLHLGSSAWIPDGTGALRPARALYWPDSDAPLVVGEDPRRYPHPELALTAPVELSEWLPFRRVDEAALDDVVANIDALLGHGQAAGPEILAWLDRGLERGHVRAGDVRAALATRRFLRDDDGILRTADEVVREGARELFGARRGTWSPGDDYTRLSAALKIAKRPGKREVLAYLDELAGIVDARRAPARRAGDAQAVADAAAASVLAEEPGLVDRLPRCLDVLAEAGGALPSRLLLACETTAGTSILCVAPDPRLALPMPPEAAEAAMRAGAPYLFPLLPEGDAKAVLALLASFGIRDLAPARAAARDARAGVARAGKERLGRAGDSERPARSAHASAAEHAGAAGSQEADARGKESAGGASDASDAFRDDESMRREDRERRDTAPEQPQSASGGVLGRLRAWLSPRRQDEQRDLDAARAAAQRQAARAANDDNDDADDHEPEREPAREPERPLAPARPPASPGRSRGGQSGARPPQGSNSDMASASDMEPPAEPDQRAWFRPRRRIGTQLHDASGWLASRQRAATYGLAFEPRSLPAPYLYGPLTIAGRFQSAGQRWLEIPLDPAWRQAGQAGAHSLTLRGRVPVGEVVLPVPLFGHVTDIHTRPSVGLLETRTGGPMLVALEDTEIEYTVTLPPAPRYEGAGLPAGIPDALLAPTADERELPDEALRFADELSRGALPPLQRVLAVRDFVRARYSYDGAYLESPELARWLERLTRGRSNRHLAALHAGRDSRYLGRGVCYELNAMACELLRRAGLPAAVATGWTFDRGYIDEPDHMWAMALLATEDGPRWLPIDASTTREGRPLHVGRRPPGPWRVPAGRNRSAPPPPAKWESSQDVRSYEPEAMPLSDLVRVVRYLEQITGQELGDTESVRALCRQILHDAGTGRGLLDLVRTLAEPGDKSEPG